MTDPAILFVKPGAIKPGDKGRLHKAGVVVVEVEDPQAVKLMRAGYELSHGDILAAAAKAIATTGAYESAREKFGAVMCAALRAQHESGQ